MQVVGVAPLAVPQLAMLYAGNMTGAECMYAALQIWWQPNRANGGWPYGHHRAGFAASGFDEYGGQPEARRLGAINLGSLISYRKFDLSSSN